MHVVKSPLQHVAQCVCPLGCPETLVSLHARERRESGHMVLNKHAWDLAFKEERRVMKGRVSLMVNKTYLDLVPV